MRHVKACQGRTASRAKKSLKKVPQIARETLIEGRRSEGGSPWALSRTHGVINKYTGLKETDRDPQVLFAIVARFSIPF